MLSSIAGDTTMTCPKCGLEFDPFVEDLVECPRCGQEGSTACCNPGGADTLCIDCNSEDGSDDVGKGVDDEY